eukprot:TRINITY_DN989_c2_g1_i2.p1 TRINITY_DN989_c2_g1~~TRINITY_DN989_c2_g1_i2.p1  ORF type:complete len:330 (-),score=114.92 TRINITY_DN989_c2_g1_i2:116-1105(-)
MSGYPGGEYGEEELGLPTMGGGAGQPNEMQEQVQNIPQGVQGQQLTAQDMEGMGNQMMEQGMNPHMQQQQHPDGNQYNPNMNPGNMNGQQQQQQQQQLMSDGGGSNPPASTALQPSNTPNQVGGSQQGTGITAGPGSATGTGGGLATQGMSVYVANLSWWTTDEEIEKICTEYGQVQEVSFFEEKANGKSKGVAQVQFAEAKSAMLCRDGLSGKMINGRACVVTFPQQSKPYGYNPNFKYDKRFSQFHEGRGAFGGRGGGGRGRWGGGYGMEGEMGMGGHMGMMGGRGGMMDGGMMGGGGGWGGPGNFGMTPYGMGGEQGYGGWRGGRY